MPSLFQQCTRTETPPPPPLLSPLVCQAYNLLPESLIAEVDRCKSRPLADVGRGTGPGGRNRRSSTSHSNNQPADGIATVNDLGKPGGEPNTQRLFDSAECRRFRDATGLEAFYR